MQRTLQWGDSSWPKKTQSILRPQKSIDWETLKAPKKRRAKAPRLVFVGVPGTLGFDVSKMQWAETVGFYKGSRDGFRKVP